MIPSDYAPSVKTKKEVYMKRIISKLGVGMVILLSLPSLSSAQWVQTTDFSAVLSRPYIVSALAADSTGILAGIIGGGPPPHSLVFRSTDNGLTWTGNLSSASNIVTCLAGIGSNLYAYSGYLYVSTDNGVNWTSIASPGNYPNFQVNCIAKCGTKLFAGSLGAYISANNGEMWVPMDSGLPIKNILALPCPSGGCGPAQLYPPNFYCFAVDGSNIYAGTNFGVFRSSDNALSWTPVNSGLTDSVVSSIMVSSILVDGSNLIASTLNSGIFMLKNNDTNWTAVNSGLPANTNVNCLLVSGDNIFAGTWGGGVFLSTNNGTSWSAVDFGLSDLNVQCLAVSGSNIFAGTYGSGIWRRPLSEMVGVINPNPQQGMLKAHASGFKINISKNGIAVLLPETLNNGAITFGLFNIAGRRVYSATHQAHNGSLNIPVSGLSTGTYLMSIRGNNTTLSSPFVVTK
jgi:hypothetical protein